jgi:Flp pilus assembly protein TadG
MQWSLKERMRSGGRRALKLLRRAGRDESGFTAVEFGIVAMPFILLLFGIMSVCLYFFTNFTMENAVWQAARAIRTGQFQQGNGSYAGLVTLEERKQAFKQALCSKAPAFIDCNKAVVLVQSTASFGGITEPKCATNGTMIDQASADASFNAGGASSVVLVTVCYPWSFGGKLPFINLGNLEDGSLLLQASVAFRTEPYQ